MVDARRPLTRDPFPLLGVAEYGRVGKANCEGVLGCLDYFLWILSCASIAMEPMAHESLVVLCSVSVISAGLGFHGYFHFQPSGIPTPEKRKIFKIKFSAYLISRRRGGLAFWWCQGFEIN